MVLGYLSSSLNLIEPYYVSLKIFDIIIKKLCFGNNTQVNKNNEFYYATEHHVAIVEPAATDSSNDKAAATNGEANHDTDASDNEKEKQVFYQIRPPPLVKVFSLGYKK